MPSAVVIGTRGYPSYYGGFETAIRQLAPYLADAGWEVTVYGRKGSTVNDDPARDPRIATPSTLGIESKSLSTLSYGLAATLDALRRKPDVALVMNVANGYWLPLLRARGIPTVTNVDGMEWERDKWGKIARAVFKTGARMTARFSDSLVFDSHEIGRRWQEEFGRQGAFIPYGGSSHDELPVEPGLSPRGYVLVVARFVPENTIPEFFEAVEKLADRTHVVIVGSSGYGGELDQAAQRLSEQHRSVHWLGHVKDDRRLFALWQHAGVYFHGHSVGGTNPALVQAMALGAPIVARDTVFNREVLGEHAGHLVAPKPEAIAGRILELLSNPAEQERLAEAAKRRGGQHYTWSGVNSEYERVLRHAIESRR